MTSGSAWGRGRWCLWETTSPLSRCCAHRMPQLGTLHTIVGCGRGCRRIKEALQLDQGGRRSMERACPAMQVVLGVVKLENLAAERTASKFPVNARHVQTRPATTPTCDDAGYSDWLTVRLKGQIADTNRATAVYRFLAVCLPVRAPVGTCGRGNRRGVCQPALFSPQKAGGSAALWKALG